MQATKQKITLILSLVISFVCYLVFYAANIHIISDVGEETYGDFYSAIKVLVVISSLVVAAKQVTMTHYSPQFERTHKKLYQTGLIPWIIKNISITAITLAMGAILFFAIMQLTQNVTFHQTFVEHPIQFIMFCAPILLFSIVSVSLALSQENISPSLISILTVVPSLVISAILVLGVHIIRPSPLPLMVVYIFCQIAIFITYAFINNRFNRARFLAQYTPYEHMHYYTKGNNFWFSTFSYQLSIGLSLLALEGFAFEHMVGEYAIILLFAMAYYSLLSPLYTYLSSQLDLHIETSPSELKPMLRSITRIQIISVLLLGLITLYLSAHLPTIITNQTGNLQNYILLSCSLFSLCMLTAPSLRIVLHSRYTQLGQKLQILQLGITVLLLVVTVPQYGLVGALLSDTLPLLMIHCIAYYICTTHLKIEPIPIR